MCREHARVSKQGGAKSTRIKATQVPSKSGSKLLSLKQSKSTVQDHVKKSPRYLNPRKKPQKDCEHMPALSGSNVLSLSV